MPHYRDRVFAWVLWRESRRRNQVSLKSEPSSSTGQEKYVQGDPRISRVSEGSRLRLTLEKSSSHLKRSEIGSNRGFGLIQSTDVWSRMELSRWKRQEPCGICLKD